MPVSGISPPGPQAALTVAGTVSGWDEALRISRDLTGRALPVARLLADAIGYAEDGIPVTASRPMPPPANWKSCAISRASAKHGWYRASPAARQPLSPTRPRRYPAHAGQRRSRQFLSRPAGRTSRPGMAALGMPVTLGDLQAHRARRPAPLSLQHRQGTLWNLAPPTQGLVSLAILGITDRLNMADADEAQTVHRIVEATKRAFALRDAHITDPRHLDVDVQQLLTPEALQPLADSIDDASASPRGGKGPGDTVWMGVVDNSGTAVSFIQSIYHEFGSGVVIPDTGIVWQNRGAAFSLDPQHLLALAPGKQPFHTLNPAAARLNDGRVMVYGSMGGDGQPQTRAALFAISQGAPLQESISPALAAGPHRASPRIH